MALNFTKNTVLLFVLLLISCGSENKRKNQNGESEAMLQQENQQPSISVGADQTEAYLPLLKGKKVGMVANQTSVIFKDTDYTHLVDSLLTLDIDVVKVFSPEHGFRGQADAGEQVKDGLDSKTGLPILSLYGVNKKPSAETLLY